MQGTVVLSIDLAIIRLHYSPVRLPISRQIHWVCGWSKSVKGCLIEALIGGIGVYQVGCAQAPRNGKCSFLKLLLKIKGENVSSSARVFMCNHHILQARASQVSFVDISIIAHLEKKKYLICPWTSSVTGHHEIQGRGRGFHHSKTWTLSRFYSSLPVWFFNIHILFWDVSNTEKKLKEWNSKLILLI